MALTRWEYKVYWHSDTEESTAQRLSDFGEDGWELVAVVHLREGWPVFYFKRPLEFEAGVALAK